MVAFYLFGTRRKNAAGVFAAGCVLLLYWAGERIFPDRTVDSPLLKEKAYIFKDMLHLFQVEI